ncbi:MAG TPA: hypothetical protein VF427_09545 [Noviherbaspirillum sp.]
MSFTVAFLILALGIAIGYRMPGPIARLKAAWRRRTYKPTLLRPFKPDDNR